MRIKLALASSLLAGALSFSTAALACPGHEKEKTAETDGQKGPAPAHVATATFKVDGMHCSGCADHVKEALNKVNGVYKVDVKVADHRVIVSWDADKTTAEKVAKAISEAGYPAAAEV
jgi:mercuric ion binding protein